MARGRANKKSLERHAASQVLHQRGKLLLNTFLISSGTVWIIALAVLLQFKEVAKNRPIGQELEALSRFLATHEGALASHLESFSRPAADQLEVAIPRVHAEKSPRWSLGADFEVDVELSYHPEPAQPVDGQPTGFLSSRSLARLHEAFATGIDFQSGALTRPLDDAMMIHLALEGRASSGSQCVLERVVIGLDALQPAQDDKGKPVPPRGVVFLEVDVDGDRQPMFVSCESMSVQTRTLPIRSWALERDPALAGRFIHDAMQPLPETRANLDRIGEGTLKEALDELGAASRVQTLDAVEVMGLKLPLTTWLLALGGPALPLLCLWAMLICARLLRQDGHSLPPEGEPAWLLALPRGDSSSLRILTLMAPTVGLFAMLMLTANALSVTEGDRQTLLGTLGVLALVGSGLVVTLSRTLARR